MGIGSPGKSIWIAQDGSAKTICCTEEEAIEICEARKETWPSDKKELYGEWLARIRERERRSDPRKIAMAKERTKRKKTSEIEKQLRRDWEKERPRENGVTPGVPRA